MYTIQEVASEMQKNIQYKKRVDGTEYYCSAEGCPEWVMDIIQAVHGEHMPDDTIWEYISDALEIIKQAESEDTAQDDFYEIEADVYTSDLTAWLNKSNHHVYYLTEGLEESEYKDGFQLLATAQHLQRREVAENTLQEIQKYINK